MTGTWMKALGVSLLLTLALECGAARLAGKRGRALLTVALANLLTNPPAVLAVLLWRNAGLPGEAFLVAGLELLAAVCEALVYRPHRGEFPHCWRFSFLLNLFSFGTGLLIRCLT